MVGPIVLAASAGIGMLAGLATADRCASGSGNNLLPLAGARPPTSSCATCGGTGKVACLCVRWSDGDAGCRPCAGTGRSACRSCRGTGLRAPVRVAVRAQGPPVAVAKAIR
ncbi:chaperone protein DnaJ-like [Panicum miliaceum]|uniref:Chaperone protein DnaJ-like n=1 Tax=Panicum miliaceum TaxID=4540 RepID=A0A3L6PUX8_PANMI|nr:chaperone protein DnaJ-like [Panicum miliaceum]